MVIDAQRSHLKAIILKQRGCFLLGVWYPVCSALSLGTSSMHIIVIPVPCTSSCWAPVACTSLCLDSGPSHAASAWQAHGSSYIEHMRVLYIINSWRPSLHS